MNPFVQFLQMLASGGGAAGAGGPVGLLAGGKGAEAAANVAKATPTTNQAAPIQSAPQGMLSGLQNLIGKDGGANLMNMGDAMMKANGPSLNPASSSFLGGLGAGLDAMQMGQAQRADTDLKRSVTQAQIGNYNSSAAQNNAQTDMIRQNAENSKALFASQMEGINGAPGQAIVTSATPTASAPAAPTGGLTPTDAAINDLRANPGNASFFDSIYGEGAASRILGAR